MAQRLVRAKRKIAGARIPYRVPPPELLGERLPGVLAVLYLIFNEGYEPTEGPLPRAELCEEAIRLARVVQALMPDEPEVIGLLALMLLQHSRRDARAGRGGELILLEEQDRALWDHDAIDEATGLLDRAIGMRAPGPYQIQAAIASIHARAPRPEDTDWPQIVSLYGALLRTAPSPVIELNRAAADLDGGRPRRRPVARGTAAPIGNPRPLSPAPRHRGGPPSKARAAGGSGGGVRAGARARDERPGAQVPPSAARGDAEGRVIHASRVRHLSASASAPTAGGVATRRIRPGSARPGGSPALLPRPPGRIPPPAAGRRGSRRRPAYRNAHARTD